MRWSVISLHSCNITHSDIYVEFIFLPEECKQGKGYIDYTSCGEHLRNVFKKRLYLRWGFFVSFVNFCLTPLEGLLWDFFNELS